MEEKVNYYFDIMNGLFSDDMNFGEWELLYNKLF